MCTIAWLFLQFLKEKDNIFSLVILLSSINVYLDPLWPPTDVAEM